MLFSSGIGRYLREILSRWPAGTAANETYLCNHDTQIDWLSVHRPGSKFRRTTAGIYSLKEQTLAATLPRRSLFWVPHYNLPWVSRAHLVATVHDAAPLVLKEVFHRPLQRIAARFYFAAARRCARHIIAVSSFTARELSSAAGVDPRKIEVVLNGVDSAWFTENLPRDRLAHRLLFVGNLKPHKNLRRLLLALQALRDRGNTRLELDIVGQVGGFRTELDPLTSSLLADSQWIRVHGAVSDETLRSLYASAGALVFPSLYEGFGLPMLEAMAAGCPVISSNTASLPEIGGAPQHEGGGVIYFNPDSPETIAAAINAFLHLPADRRNAMAVAGHRRAKTFSWAEAARRTHDILLHQAATIPV